MPSKGSELSEPVQTSEAFDRLRGEVERLRDLAEGNRQQIERLRTQVQERDASVLDIFGCAALLQVSPRTVERRVQQNQIPHVKIGGDKCVRFVRKDIIDWLRRGCPRPGTPRLHSKRRSTEKRKRRLAK